MYKHLIEKSKSSSLKESKQYHNIVKLIRLMTSESKSYTHEDICNILKISAPTGLKLVSKMLKGKLIIITGKRETENGRRPSLYSINKKNFLAIGIEILLKRISITLIDIEFNQLYTFHDRSFRLENTQECLNLIINFIKYHIEKIKIKESSLIGVGISITGRVNPKLGTTYNYFNFLEIPFAEFVSNQIFAPVFIENDTRSITLSELTLGKAKNLSNAIVVNLSRGLGASIILNNTIVIGGKGFAGEFGHMQFNTSNEICICGKSGCLGTTISGYGLEESFKKKIASGEKSIITWPNENFRYDDIINAALNGDSLSIQLIHDICVILGKSLGNIMNLLNPEKIILAGKFAKLSGLLLSPVKMGLMTTALPNLLQSCEIEVSDISENAGIIGAGLHVFKSNNLL